MKVYLVLVFFVTKSTFSVNSHGSFQTSYEIGSGTPSEQEIPVEEEDLPEEERGEISEPDYYTDSYGEVDNQPLVKYEHKTDSKGNSVKNDKAIPVEYQNIQSRKDKPIIFGFKPDSNIMDAAEQEQYEAEIKAGDVTRFLGTNQHRYQPDMYHIYDLGRRFVLQYPYREIKQNNNIEDVEDNSLIPKRAPPEFVIAIAKKSKLIQDSQPVDPNEHLIKKESLRNGQYWNAYWREDIEDPENMLRSPRTKNNKLDTILTKLSPGTPVYDYVSKLNKLYPKLLYVVNKNNDS